MDIVLQLYKKRPQIRNGKLYYYGYKILMLLEYQKPPMWTKKLNRQEIILIFHH